MSTLICEKSCSRSSRLNVTVSGLNWPAFGLEVPALKDGANGSVAGHAPPLPSQSTLNCELGVASLREVTDSRDQAASRPDSAGSLPGQAGSWPDQLGGFSSLPDQPGSLSSLAASLPDPVLRRRARHVISENERVERVAYLLRAGQLAATGVLLTQSHRSLRDDFEVSWPQADVAVDAALAAGAAGARMTGGGFGGCVLALVPADRAAPLRAGVSAAFAARGWQQPAFLDAVPAGSAQRIL